MTVNEIAAQWWADRFKLEDKREELKAALLKHLPDGDWQTYNDYDDYDPDGPLLLAVRDVTECRGFMFYGDGMFPRLTGLRRRGDELMAKEGYGADWIVVPNAERGVVAATDGGIGAPEASPATTPGGAPCWLEPGAPHTSNAPQQGRRSRTLPAVVGSLNQEATT